MRKRNAGNELRPFAPIFSGDLLPDAKFMTYAGDKLNIPEHSVDARNDRPRLDWIGWPPRGGVEPGCAKRRPRENRFSSCGYNTNQNPDPVGLGFGKSFDNANHLCTAVALRRSLPYRGNRRANDRRHPDALRGDTTARRRILVLQAPLYPHHWHPGFLVARPIVRLARGLSLHRPRPKAVSLPSPSQRNDAAVRCIQVHSFVHGQCGIDEVARLSSFEQEFRSLPDYPATPLKPSFFRRSQTCHCHSLAH
jgi:hypothetical protein